LFPAAFGYPVPQSEGVFSGGQRICQINPNLKSQYTSNWNLSLQRQLPGKFILEVDYVGNKSTHMWHFENQDEVNIFENGSSLNSNRRQLTLRSTKPMARAILSSITVWPGEPAAHFPDCLRRQRLQCGSFQQLRFRQQHFITDLTEGLAGSLANPLASTSTSTLLLPAGGVQFRALLGAGVHAVHGLSR
jgi:hypothetical protein